MLAVLELRMERVLPRPRVGLLARMLRLEALPTTMQPGSCEPVHLLPAGAELHISISVHQVRMLRRVELSRRQGHIAGACASSGHAWTAGWSNPCESCWAHGIHGQWRMAQGASGAGLHEVGHVAWLRLLLPDEPPTTLRVNPSALAGELLWLALGLLMLIHLLDTVFAQLFGVALEPEHVRVQLCLWLTVVCTSRSRPSRQQAPLARPGQVWRCGTPPRMPACAARLRASSSLQLCGSGSAMACSLQRRTAMQGARAALVSLRCRTLSTWASVTPGASQQQ